ncbi:MAG: ABC transporter ATP-binding protein [Acidimicrobiia bacterium]
MAIDATTAIDTPIAIELRDIVKRFPGVIANDGVNLTVRRGTIHAIVGENGAGKSTLMKTLYGAHRPDEGTVTVNGVEEHFKSPKDAIAAGIGMVFQHFMLADNFEVWENVVLGDEPGTQFRIDRSGAVARMRELSREYGLDVDPEELVSDLGVGQKQRVEILKVLYRGASILILDEPTAVLVPQEVDELFTSLRELTAGGATIIFISHKLDEVLSVADAITVIRNGRTVAEVADPSTVTARDLAELMVGSELPSPETRERTVRDEIRLRVVDMNLPGEGRPLLEHINITVHAGEIVGIAGVEGNGQSELIQALIGLHPAASGTIELNGVDATHQSTSQRRSGGLGYISEDRQHDGMVLSATIWENTMLGHQRDAPFARGPWIDRKAAMQRAKDVIQEFDVRTPGADLPAFTLSGGNQQKLIVGREMLAEPSVLLAAHPTRGVDVGAQAAIWDIIRDARAKGLGVLLVSADLDELIGLSDRLLVMLRGRVVAELDPSHVTPAELGSYMTGAKQAEGGPA